MAASGIEQVQELAKELVAENMKISYIYSSDLDRAKETTKILADYLKCPIIFYDEFREVNNGDPAGMENELADENIRVYIGQHLDMKSVIRMVKVLKYFLSE